MIVTEGGRCVGMHHCLHQVAGVTLAERQHYLLRAAARVVVGLSLRELNGW